MSERPIIFSGPMVRAILGGRKTMTRRALKPQPEQNSAGLWVFPPKWTKAALKKWKRAVQTDEAGLREMLQSEGTMAALTYAPGDTLWVRETWAQACELDDNEKPASAMMTYYRADGEPFSRWLDPDTDEWRDGIKWNTSIFMPRWASRVTLKVTGVKVERLQDISVNDAVREGAYFKRWTTGEYPELDVGVDADNRALLRQFQDIWQSIHGPDSWEANLWVAAISFERLTPPPGTAS